MAMATPTPATPGATPAATPGDFDALLTVQEHLEQLDDEAAAAVLSLESRYGARRAPLYAQRTALIAKLPGFWSDVFAADTLLAQLLTRRDSVLLSHVVRFDCEPLSLQECHRGFRLILELDSANPLFQDSTLTKEFRVDAQGGCDVRATQPTWRRTAESEHGPSFIGWFTRSETIPSGERDELAEHLKSDVFANPLNLLLTREKARMAKREANAA